MSVSTSRYFRVGTGNSVPLLVPLWDRTAEPYPVAAECSLLCGSSVSCQLRIRLPGVAPEHCRLQFRNGVLTVHRDAVHEATVWVNDVPVGRQCILEPNDILAVGPASFRIEATAVVSADNAFSVARSAQSCPVPASWHPYACYASGNSYASGTNESAVSDSEPVADLQSRPVEGCTDRQEHCPVLNDEAIEGIKQALRNQMLQEQLLREQHLRMLAEELEQRQQDLDQKEKEFIERRDNHAEVLKKSDASPENLTAQNSNFEMQLVELDKVRSELSESLQYTESLRVQLENRAAELESREQRCGESAERLTSWEARISDLDAELNARLSSLQEKETRISGLIDELTLRDTAFASRDEEVTRREDGLQLRQILLDEREAELLRRDQECRDQQQAFIEQQTQSLHQNAAASSEVRLADESLIAELRKDLDAREALLSRRESDLIEDECLVKEQREFLELRLNEVQQKESELVESEQQLRIQQKQLDEQLTMIAGRECHATELEHRILEQQQMLDLRDSGITRREENLAGREQEILELSESLNQKHRELAQREAELLAAQTALNETTHSAGLQAADCLRREQLNAADSISLRELERELSELSASLTNRDTELRELESSLRQQEITVRMQADQAAETENSLRAMQLNLEDIRQTNQSCVDEIAVRETALNELSRRLSEEASLLKQDRQILDDERRLLESERAEQEQLSRQLREQTADIQRQREEHRSAAAAWTVEQSEKLGELNKCRRDLESCMLTLSLREQEIEARADEISQRVTAAKSLLSAVAGEQRSSVSGKSVETADPVLVHQLQVLRDEKAAVETELSRMAQQLNETETICRSLASEAAETKQTALALASAEEQARSVTDERDRLVSSLRDLQVAFEQIRGEMTENEQSRNELQEELDLQRSVTAERDRELSERDKQLAEIQQQLCETLQVTDRQTETTIERLTQRFSAEREMLEARLEDCDNVIRQLREQLKSAARSAPEALPSAQDCQSTERELDQRAGLLDQREEDLRGLEARLQNSRDDLELQRRQMMEARQQLELARAEIQLAMTRNLTPGSSGVAGSESFRFAEESADQHEAAVREFSDDSRNWNRDAGSSSEERWMAMEDAVSTPADMKASSGSDADEESLSATHEEVSQLRSELANLFGLKNKKVDIDKAEIFADPSLPNDGASQAGVEMRFSGGHDLLLTPPMPVPQAEADPVEEESPDFVTNYMEQLLARSRKVAGGALPNELQGANKGRSEPEKKPKPQVTSFLDQYMSGQMGNLDSQNGEGDAGVARPDNAIPRPKIDRARLRENMDSFRSVSAISVENALSAAAMRKERHFIAGRIAFFTLLVVLSIAQIVATLIGKFQQPMVMWTSLAATVVVGLELARKLTGIRGRIRTVLAGASPRGVSAATSAGTATADNPIITENPAAAMGRESVTEAESNISAEAVFSATTAGRNAEKRSDFSAGVEHAAAVPAAIRQSAPVYNVNNADDGDDSQYFEL